VTTQQGRAQDLPYQDGEFDAVVLGEILEHVDDPEVVLAEAYRVVKVGGIVIASTPIGSHHWDPLHIASEEGGWSVESITKLVSPYDGKDLVTKGTIAEEGTEKSCFLFTVTRASADHQVDAGANVSARQG
jgi:ubiquinone/menaquinone biosynthesis C-methylase UbiE